MALACTECVPPLLPSSGVNSFPFSLARPPSAFCHRTLATHPPAVCTSSKGRARMNTHTHHTGPAATVRVEVEVGTWEEEHFRLQSAASNFAKETLKGEQHHTSTTLNQLAKRNNSVQAPCTRNQLTALQAGTGPCSAQQHVVAHVCCYGIECSTAPCVHLKESSVIFTAFMAQVGHYWGHVLCL